VKPGPVPPTTFRLCVARRTDPGLGSGTRHRRSPARGGSGARPGGRARESPSPPPGPILPPGPDTRHWAPFGTPCPFEPLWAAAVSAPLSAIAQPAVSCQQGRGAPASALPAGRLLPGRLRTERDLGFGQRLVIKALQHRRSGKRDHGSSRCRGGRAGKRSRSGQRVHKQIFGTHGGLSSGMGSGPAYRRTPRHYRLRPARRPCRPWDRVSVPGTGQGPVHARADKRALPGSVTPCVVTEWRPALCQHLAPRTRRHRSLRRPLLPLGERPTSLDVAFGDQRRSFFGSTWRHNVSIESIERCRGGRGYSGIPRWPGGRPVAGLESGDALGPTSGPGPCPGLSRRAPRDAGSRPVRPVAAPRG
jgi:hypothetical protein